MAIKLNNNKTVVSSSALVAKSSTTVSITKPAEVVPPTFVDMVTRKKARLLSDWLNENSTVVYDENGTKYTFYSVANRSIVRKGENFYTLVLNKPNKAKSVAVFPDYDSTTKTASGKRQFMVIMSDSMLTRLSVSIQTTMKAYYAQYGYSSPVAKETAEYYAIFDRVSEKTLKGYKLIEETLAIVGDCAARFEREAARLERLQTTIATNEAAYNALNSWLTSWQNLTHQIDAHVTTREVALGNMLLNSPAPKPEAPSVSTKPNKKQAAVNA